MPFAIVTRDPRHNHIVNKERAVVVVVVPAIIYSLCLKSIYSRLDYL